LKIYRVLFFEKRPTPIGHKYRFQ